VKRFERSVTEPFVPPDRRRRSTGNDDNSDRLERSNGISAADAIE